jgi:N-acyl homoserine lactone hydrolase
MAGVASGSIYGTPSGVPAISFFQPWLQVRQWTPLGSGCPQPVGSAADAGSALYQSTRNDGVHGDAVFAQLRGCGLPMMPHLEAEQAAPYFVPCCARLVPPPGGVYSVSRLPCRARCRGRPYRINPKRGTPQGSIHGRTELNRLLTIAAASVCAVVFAELATPAHAAPDMALTRFDCGTPQAPTLLNQRFSDTYAYGDMRLQLVYSCYLIKHGDEYLLWDTGHAMTMPNVAPKVSLVDLLAKIDLKPDQIKYVGISHYHADHTGQVNSFPNATVLIGKGDWEAITSPKPAEGVNFKPFENWIKGEGKVEPVALDKDVFGDGSVIMLYTPGHTPGHHSLLVKLPQTGNVILTGDAAHFRENYDSDGVPAFNVDRSQTVASIERLKAIASNLKAIVVIQHDPRDVDKLPAFPAAAK